MSKYSLAVLLNAGLSFIDGNASFLADDLKRADHAHFTGVDAQRIAVSTVNAYILQGDFEGFFDFVKDWETVLRPRAAFECQKDLGDAWHFNTEQAYTLMVMGKVSCFRTDDWFGF